MSVFVSCLVSDQLRVISIKAVHTGGRGLCQKWTNVTIYNFHWNLPNSPHSTVLWTWWVLLSNFDIYVFYLLIYFLYIKVLTFEWKMDIFNVLAVLIMDTGIWWQGHCVTVIIWTWTSTKGRRDGFGKSGHGRWGEKMREFCGHTLCKVPNVDSRTPAYLYAGYLGRRQLLQYRHFQMNFCLADFCFSSCILVSFIQHRS